MTTLDPSPLPHPAKLSRPYDPVTFCLETLEYAAHNPVTTATSPTERRATLYYTAVSYLAETYPEDKQGAVYKRFAARLPTTNTPTEVATADELRVATLTAYGLATDPKLGKTTWTAAAVAALQLYRDRSIKHLVGRPATPAAVPA